MVSIFVDPLFIQVRKKEEKLNGNQKNICFDCVAGDLMNEDQLLGWLLHQKKHVEIPEVTDEMMEKLVETAPYMAVLFCKRPIYL